MTEQEIDRFVSGMVTVENYSKLCLDFGIEVNYQRPLGGQIEENFQAIKDKLRASIIEAVEGDK
jgi:hypothetical protein